MTVCTCDYSIIIAIASSVVHYYTADLVLDIFLRTSNTAMQISCYFSAMEFYSYT